MTATIIFTEGQIRERVVELAQQISADYRGRDIMLVGLLNGCVHFLSDLNREVERIRLRGDGGVNSCTLDFMRVSSYEEGQESLGRVRVEMDMQKSPAHKDVIIVDEIAETLNTTEFVVTHIGAKSPASIRVCVLISKPDAENRREGVELHYVGFEQPGLPFLKGYGMDDKGTERGLPHISDCPPSE